jgi:hypothetical protein
VSRAGARWSTLANLERRFLPCLEVDISDTQIQIVAVDLEAAAAAVRARQLSKASFAMLKRISAGLRRGQTWHVETLRGTFGPPRILNQTIADLGQIGGSDRKPPPDAWTAIRLLPEGSKVALSARAVCAVQCSAVPSAMHPC